MGAGGWSRLLCYAGIEKYSTGSLAGAGPTGEAVPHLSPVSTQPQTVVPAETDALSGMCRASGDALRPRCPAPTTFCSKVTSKVALLDPGFSEGPQALGPVP